MSITTTNREGKKVTFIIKDKSGKEISKKEYEQRATKTSARALRDSGYKKKNDKFVKKSKGELILESKAKASQTTSDIVEESGEKRPETLEGLTAQKQVLYQQENTNRNQEILEEEIKRGNYTEKQKEELRSGRASLNYGKIPTKTTASQVFYTKPNNTPLNLSFGENIMPTKDEGFYYEASLKGSVTEFKPQSKTNVFIQKVKSKATEFISKETTIYPEELKAVYTQNQNLFGDIKVQGQTIQKGIERNIQYLEKSEGTQKGVPFVLANVGVGGLKLVKSAVTKPVSSTVEVVGFSKLFKIIGAIPKVGTIATTTLIGGGVVSDSLRTTKNTGSPIKGVGVAIQDVTQLGILYGAFRKTQNTKLKTELSEGKVISNPKEIKALIERKSELEILGERGVSTEYKISPVNELTVIARKKGNIVDKRINVQYGKPETVTNLPNYDFVSVQGDLLSLTKSNTQTTQTNALIRGSAVYTSQPIKGAFTPRSFSDFISGKFPESSSPKLLEGKTSFSEITNKIFNKFNPDLLTSQYIKAGKQNTVFESKGVDFTNNPDYYQLGRYNVKVESFSPEAQKGFNFQYAGKYQEARPKTGGLNNLRKIFGKAQGLFKNTFIEKYFFKNGVGAREIKFTSEGAKIEDEIFFINEPVKHPSSFENDYLSVKPKKSKPYINLKTTKTDIDTFSNGQVVTLQKPVQVTEIKIKTKTKTEQVSKLLNKQKTVAYTVQESSQEQKTKQDLKSKKVFNFKEEQEFFSESKEKVSQPILHHVKSKTSSTIKLLRESKVKSRQKRRVSSLSAINLLRENKTTQAQTNMQHSGQFQDVQHDLNNKLEPILEQLESSQNRLISPSVRPSPEFINDFIKESKNQIFKTNTFDLTKKKQSILKGFNVFTKQRGQFKRVNPNPLSFAEAKALGGFSTGHSSSATFKIEPDKTGAKLGSFQGTFKDYQFNKKGNIFTEKNKFRINSLGELQEITHKGLLVKKAKSVFARRS